MAEPEEKPARSPGRPRNDASGPALLAAARRLVIQRGYQAVSTQMIASAAGVGRQTLYRRWPSKADLVLDAFLESAGHADPLPDLPVEDALLTFLDQLFRHLERDGPAIRSLIASAQDDDAFRQTFRDRFADPRAARVAAILQRAIDRRELPASDLSIALAVFHGAFWYRLLLGQPLDAGFGRSLVTFLLNGLGRR